MISVSFKNHTSKKISLIKIKKIVNDHMMDRGKDSASLEIEIIGKAKMQNLNKKFLHKNCPTDVLSFPLPIISSQDKILGTIFLCRDIIELNSEKYGVSFESEFEKMLRHGIDHLLGIHHK